MGAPSNRGGIVSIQRNDFRSRRWWGDAGVSLKPNHKFLKRKFATYWDILRLGSCQTYQLLYGHVLQSTFTSLCDYLVRFPPKVVFLRQTRYCTCDFTWELKWCVPRLFCCYFFIRGLCSDSLRFLLSLFIGYGLIGKGIHTCRRTFEFLTSGYLRHSGQIVTFFIAKG